MEIAIKKDINKEYVEAVELYEESIKNDDASIEVYTNLAFLYWLFATEEMSFNKPNKIPDELSLIGGNRFGEIIQQGIKKYPDSLELTFLNRYFPYRLFFDEFTQQDCEQMIDDHPDNESLIPYFFLYLFDKEKYKSEKDKLLSLCNEIPSAKLNYIKSIID